MISGIYSELADALATEVSRGFDIVASTEWHSKEIVTYAFSVTCEEKDVARNVEILASLVQQAITELRPTERRAIIWRVRPAFEWDAHAEGRLSLRCRVAML